MRNIIKAGLRRLAAPAPVHHPIGRRHGKIIAVAAQKGGVGKTTTSVNLAAALARFHHLQVLLVDLDPQGHVSTALKEQIQAGGGLLSSVLTDTTGTREVMDITTGTDIPGLRCTPYDPNLAAAEDLIGTRIGKELVLKDALRATRTHYDVVILDCPPNLGNLALNGLVAADQVLIPCDPSPLAVKGVQSIVRTISTVAGRLNPDIDVLGVLMTRVDGRNRTLNEQVTADIETDALIPIQIGISASLAKAQQRGVDIFGFDPDGRGADQYRELSGFVVDHLGIE